MLLNAWWAAILIKWHWASWQGEGLGELKEEFWGGAWWCPSVQALPGVWCFLKLMAALNHVHDGDEVAWLTKTPKRVLWGLYCAGKVMNEQNQPDVAVWKWNWNRQQFHWLLCNLSNKTSLLPCISEMLRRYTGYKEVTRLHSRYGWRCWGVGECSALSHITHRRGTACKSPPAQDFFNKNSWYWSDRRTSTRRIMALGVISKNSLCCCFLPA